MSKSLIQRLVSIALVPTLSFATAEVAHADTKEKNEAASDVPQVTDEDLAFVDSFFAYVEAMPDDLVQNGSNEEIEAYLQANQPGTIEGRSPILMNYNAWECAGAIALIIGGAVVPVAKVVKLIRLIKGADGAQKVTRAIEEAGGIKEILRTGGTSIKAQDMKAALLEIAEELSGIGLAAEKR
ncbi:hypothetical protein H7347_09420 [Corynebacterium sp. zg-331]|uniref:hypothetical protein n=1 Tax=unclassified Corynebacterium TaxID=2624378 RepID=UPI00128E0924|nr:MULTISPECIES: hypothetical protein [unclassified Corynebacterium]MBC3186781.1 hypothetical protein [Corynebacterium sp. zg-331]MPV53262.1 hypothetical protein [Corynebacterium sp. zg331]